MADLPTNISLDDILANLKRLHAEGEEVRADLAKSASSASEPSSQTHGAHEGAELSHEVLHTVENVAEEIAEHPHRSKSAKESQWFYAQETKRVGPLPQSNLLELFERGELPWTTLVWTKKFADWTQASETELFELSGSPTPPPLPTEKKKKGARKK